MLGPIFEENIFTEFICVRGLVYSGKVLVLGGKKRPALGVLPLVPTGIVQSEKRVAVAGVGHSIRGFYRRLYESPQKKLENGSRSC